MSEFLRELLQKADNPIQILGFVGQAVFFARFAIQWIASERRRESVIPLGFWWCSIVGGSLTLVYGLMIKEPPIILGQLFGNVVYTRNLVLVYRRRRRAAAAPAPAAETRP